MAPQSSKTQKLKRLPDSKLPFQMRQSKLIIAAHQLRKRPPHRPAIPSPYVNASSPKVVYVSSTTPFMSAVKRVRHLLSLVEKRSLGRINLGQKASDRHLLAVLKAEQERKDRGEHEAVTVKGMGKAIEKVLQMALFFQDQADCAVQIRTTSLNVVDDIVEKERDENYDAASLNKGEEEIPTIQTRKVSVLEVAVRLR